MCTFGWNLDSLRFTKLKNRNLRQDTLLKTMLGVPQLVQKDKIAKAERDDQRKD